MTHKSTFILAMVAASGTAASADIFNWAGGDGNWNNHTRWFGPANQYPDSILDSATVSGNFVEVLLNANTVTGTLNVLNGAGVYNIGNSLFVSGDTQINGQSSVLAVRESPALRDFDTDTLLIRNGAYFILGDALAQFDESVSIEQGSVILGVGIIEMNSTTGDLDIVDGAIWADNSGMNGDTLLISRTQSSTSRLNWTHPGSNLISWPGTTIDIQIPFTGSLGGSIHVSGDSTILSENAIVGSANSDISLFGGVLAGPDYSVIEAPIIDLYGSMVFNHQGVLRAPFIALRGTGEMGSDSELNIDATSIILDSLSISPIDDDGGLVRFGVNSTTLNVIGGTTTINTGVGGQFDLDGFGDMDVNIASGSSLILDVEFIERFGSNMFDTTLNIDGLLDVKEVVANNSWTNSGEIVLDGGVVAGRDLVNDTVITGSGTISATVMNNGEVIADGSTLFIDSIDLDGVNETESGIIRAQTGDIVCMSDPLFGQFFSGSMYIGDGAGGREVFEANFPMWFIVDNAAVGLLEMNSGRLRADRVHLDSLFSTTGVSLINASGNQSFDVIRFGANGTNTISGILELSGNTVIEAGAVFQGEGTMNGTNTNDTIDLANGASLGDVSLEAWGGVSIDDNNGVGEASVASLELVPTSKFKMDLAGDNNGVEHDQLAVLDSATVDGTLVLSVVDGFSVSFGDVITILTADSVSGEFSDLDLSGLEFGQWAQVQMYPDHVDVLITCRADLHTNGQLNFFDVSAFLNAYSMEDPIADFTNDGLFNFFDVSAFLQAFNAGCP